PRGGRRRSGFPPFLRGGPRLEADGGQGRAQGKGGPGAALRGLGGVRPHSPRRWPWSAAAAGGRVPPGLPRGNRGPGRGCGPVGGGGARVGGDVGALLL